jgi:hypothetical protein
MGQIGKSLAILAAICAVAVLAYLLAPHAFTTGALELHFLARIWLLLKGALWIGALLVALIGFILKKLRHGHSEKVAEGPMPVATGTDPNGRPSPERPSA